MNNASKNIKNQYKPPTSVFEGIKEIGNQTARSAIKQVGGMVSDGIQSAFGGRLPIQQNSESNGLDSALGARLQTPEYMRSSMFGQKKEKPRDVEIFSFAERRETLETGEQIRKLVVLIKEEVKRIEEQNNMMIAQTAKITVEQLPDNPGIYHVRFFEWLLNLFRDIRKKVSESASWLSIARGKQKKGYWGMAKKKGTSFTLSGERTASTQSG